MMMKILCGLGLYFFLNLSLSFHLLTVHLITRSAVASDLMNYQQIFDALRLCYFRANRIMDCTLYIALPAEMHSVDWSGSNEDIQNPPRRMSLHYFHLI